MMRTFKMVDLFAGAGGFSEGFRRACAAKGVGFDLVAINHWPTAVQTHSLNHPTARHYCESVYEVDPRRVVADGRIDCLTASPECIYHSNARGGGPCDDQSRSGAKDILRWIRALDDVPTIVVENVREFMKWGPLDGAGLPIRARQGETFREFCAGLRELGYAIDYAVLNSANYGAYTARERFFMLACKHGTPFAGWPEFTHMKNPDRPFVRRWHSARDIIDFSLAGDSVALRQAGLLPGKKPLVRKTLDRIAYGLEHISGLKGPALEPFLLMLYGTGTARSLDRPLPTVTSSAGGHMALVEPFLTKHHGGALGHTRCYGLDRPLPTVDTSNRFGLAQPFVTVMRGCSKAVGLENPLPTITAGPGNLNLCEPFLTEHYGNGKAVGLRPPLPTVTTKDRFGLCVPVACDLRYRLLEPHELAAGMGFDGYKFAGTKTEIKKQIGNAVEVNQSLALANRVVEAWLAA